MFEKTDAFYYALRDFTVRTPQYTSITAQSSKVFFCKNSKDFQSEM